MRKQGITGPPPCFSVGDCSVPEMKKIQSSVTSNSISMEFRYFLEISLYTTTYLFCSHILNIGERVFGRLKISLHTMEQPSSNAFQIDSINRCNRRRKGFLRNGFREVFIETTA
ncbi:hypothetical protein NE237_020475 [Protea cynaroides]|uniref:Uncharacterized protein n=1 Tax=Protea cynaroides TaxID=273540 RepID=A0A9Q0H9G6_9MAGN|nr:hypothetical protein NE237_020475 [Protea cynaroides]